MRAPEQIIKRPLLTEKGTFLKETGGRSDETPEAEQLAPQVVFEVARDANKIEIKRAVEEVFNVKVTTVNTIKVPGKLRRFGQKSGMTRVWKKAVVTLAPGERIELFQGV